MPQNSESNRPKRAHRFVPVALILGAAWGFVPFHASAGEPIRFIRPKAQEKAPLRFDYSSGPAQAKEKGSIGLPQGSSGPRVPSTISVNRRPRDAGRKKWDMPEVEAGHSDATVLRARVEMERWRRSAEEEERSSRQGGLFKDNFNSVPNEVETKASKPPSDFGLRGLNGDSPARGSAFSPWGWNAQSTPGANPLRPEAPSLPSPAPSFRPDSDSSLANPSVTQPPQSPRPEQTPGWGVRPLPSFELPGRPR